MADVFPPFTATGYDRYDDQEAPEGPPPKRPHWSSLQGANGGVRMSGPGDTAFDKPEMGEVPSLLHSILHFNAPEHPSASPGEGLHRGFSGSVMSYGMPTTGSIGQYAPMIRPFMTRSPGGYLVGPGPIGSEAGRAAMAKVDADAVRRLLEKATKPPVRAGNDPGFSMEGK